MSPRLRGLITFMDLLPRRLPWTLALAGAVHGYYGSPEQKLGDGGRPIAIALVFASAFFVAGWIHVRGRSTLHGGLWRAAAKILVCCAVFGAIPGLFFGWHTLPYAARGALVALLVGVTALPSALLLVHAHSRRQAPRAGSLLAGSDRAEDALAMVGAMLLLPWWRASRPLEVALILVLVSLPAVAIGIHAAILAKQASLLVAAFPHVAASCSSDATIVHDVGFGSDQREARMLPANAYRASAVRRAISCQGDVHRGSRAAHRLLCCSLVVCVVAAAQVIGLLVDFERDEDRHATLAWQTLRCALSEDPGSAGPVDAALERAITRLGAEGFAPPRIRKSARNSC